MELLHGIDGVMSMNDGQFQSFSVAARFLQACSAGGVSKINGFWSEWNPITLVPVRAAVVEVEIGPNFSQLFSQSGSQTRPMRAELVTGCPGAELGFHRIRDMHYAQCLAKLCDGFCGPRFIMCVPKRRMKRREAAFAAPGQECHESEVPGG
jgi:hypothetical protein